MNEQVSSNDLGDHEACDRRSYGWQFDWAGRFSETGFLCVSTISPSYPPTIAARQQRQVTSQAHRESFRDWDDGWIFYDDRFELLRCADREFLRFLAETVHPVVRPSSEERLKAKSSGVACAN